MSAAAELKKLNALIEQGLSLALFSRANSNLYYPVEVFDADSGVLELYDLDTQETFNWWPADDLNAVLTVFVELGFTFDQAPPEKSDGD